MDSSVMILLRVILGPNCLLLSAFQTGNALFMNLSDVQQASAAFGNLTHILAKLTETVSKLSNTLSKLTDIPGEQFH